MEVLGFRRSGKGSFGPTEETDVRTSVVGVLGKDLVQFTTDGH